MFKFLKNIMNNEESNLTNDAYSLHRILKTDIKKDPNEKEDLFLPSFISEEITGLTHYSNFSLANNPFSDWKED